MIGTVQDKVRGAALRRGLLVGLAFACVMGLALFVRLYRIGEETFHFDEALTLKGILCLDIRPFWEAFQRSRWIDPPMAPVYFFVQYAWATIVGLTALRLRLLSVLFSAATFVVVFFIGRRLKGNRTGLAAMFFLAVSPMHVYYSLEMRNYPLTALLGTLSLLTLLRGLERPGWRSWTLNFAVDLLLGMSHLFANLLFVPQAIFLLAYHRRRAVLFPWGLSHAVISAVVGLWLRSCDFAAIRRAVVGAWLATGEDAAIREASYRIVPLSWTDCYEMLRAVSGASYAWADSAVIGRTGAAGAFIVVLFLLGLAALLAEWIVSRRAVPAGGGGCGARPAAHGVSLIALTVIVPPLLLALFAQGYPHSFLVRYVVGSVVAAPVLLGCALTVPRWRGVRAVLAVALVLANAGVLEQELRTRPQRRVWTPLRGYLSEEIRQEDRLVMFSSGKMFCSEIEMLLSVPPERCAHRKCWSAADYEELSAWHARGIRVWCVTGTDDPDSTTFETILGLYNLPFRRHLFSYYGYVIYCIPAGPEESAPPDTAVTHVPLDSGGLRGRLAVCRRDSGNNIGLTHLVCGEHPLAPVFTHPSLGLQSVMEGRTGGAHLVWDILFGSSMRLRAFSPACAEARWSLKAAARDMDFRMRYSFSGNNAVDMLFEVTPRAGQEFDGPFVFSLKSQINGACSPAIHFPGLRDGVEGWVCFGEDSAERGVVFGTGHPEEEWPGEVAASGLCAVRHVRFSEPVFYGLVDGGQNNTTDDAGMAFILMCDHPEDTRFVLRDPGAGSPGTGWDWQYVLRAPAAGRTCGQRARLVYKPFRGEEDVLAEYRAWRDAAPSTEVPAGDGGLLVPIFRGPDQERVDLVSLADRLAGVDREKALDAYAALLEVPLYRQLAVSRIDDYYMRFGDHAGLAARWAAIAARGKQDPLPWSRLGQALYRAGDAGKAADAFARGLEADSRNPDCLLGLATVRLAQGNSTEAFDLARSAVDSHPEYSAQAADLCAAAGRLRLAAGDASGAEPVLRAALEHAPGDASTKILLGRLLADRCATDEALALFDEVLAVRPDTAGQLADACGAAAQACMKAGNPSGAVPMLRRARVLSPNNLNHRMALGEALEAIRDDAGALEEFLAVAGEMPESPRSLADIAAILDRGGTSGFQVEFWRRLIEARPDALIPRLHLGLALEAAGDREGGLAMIKEVAAARPGVAGQAAEACAASGKEMLAAGDARGAVPALRRARALTPQVVGYWADLARALEAAGDGAAALEEYRAVVDAVPESPKSSARIDVLLDAGGDRPARVREWTGMSSRHPEAAIPRLHLGLALEANGDGAGAAAAYRQALLRNAKLESDSVLFKKTRDGGGPGE